MTALILPTKIKEPCGPISSEKSQSGLCWVSTQIKYLALRAWDALSAHACNPFNDLRLGFRWLISGLGGDPSAEADVTSQGSPALGAVLGHHQHCFL